MTLKQKFLFTGILCLAIFFGFWLITTMPGGLFPDEAANGLDVNLMQQGHLQPFYERGNGREALFFYLEWGSTTLFNKISGVASKGQWQFHAAAAFEGVLGVIACYFVTYRIFLMDTIVGNPAILDEETYKRKKNRAINIALLAMFLMVASSWHIVISRTAFRATTIPLFSALTMYFLLRTYQATTTKAKIWFALLFGSSFALGFYTYIAFRIMAPILFMVIAWPLLGQIKFRKFWSTVGSYKAPIIAFVCAFIVVIFPIAKYFYQHPGSFIGRAGQVSVFNQTLYTVNGVQLTSRPPLSVVVAVAGEVFKAQFLGFFIHGDLNWRQNISGYPFLSPLISPFFGFGIAVILVLALWYFFAPNKRAGWWKFYVLFGWFFGMLLPVVTTAEGIPHGLRGIGAMPPVFIITAWALYEFAVYIYKKQKELWEKCWCHPKNQALLLVGQPQDDRLLTYDEHPHNWHFTVIDYALKAVVVCFCVALIAQTYILYFVYAANSPEYFYAFRADLTAVSQNVLDHCYQTLQQTGLSSKENTFLVLDQYSIQTTDYLTSDPVGNSSQPCNVPYHQVDPEHVWELPKLLPGQEVVFTQSSMFDTKKYKQYHPEAHLALEVRNQFQEDVVAVYKTNP